MTQLSKLNRLSGFFILISLMSGAVNAKEGRKTATLNKAVVVDFYTMAFNAHQPEEAVKKYVGDRYIQHNVADGAQAFIEFFVPFQKEHPKAHAEIKRVIAASDLVVLHVHSFVDEKDPGRAVMDIFRLENGKIVEHWDVAQAIPEKPANSPTVPHFHLRASVARADEAC